MFNDLCSPSLCVAQWKKLRTHWACVVTWNGWKINREANSSSLPSSRNSALLKILLTPNIPNLNHFHVGETESFLNTQRSHFHNEEGGKFCQIAQFFFLFSFAESFLATRHHHQFTSRRRVESHHLKFEIFFISSGLDRINQLNLISTPCHFRDFFVTDSSRLSS